MQLIWTELALDDYDNCINYLEKYFSEKVVKDFLFMLEKNCSLILQNPTTFPLTGIENTRTILIIPEVSIFYSIKNENEILIIRIWNNRKNKKNLLKGSK